MQFLVMRQSVCYHRHCKISDVEAVFIRLILGHGLAREAAHTYTNTQTHMHAHAHSTSTHIRNKSSGTFSLHFGGCSDGCVSSCGVCSGPENVPAVAS